MLQEDILYKPVVALVILSWNGQKFLEQFLPSVVRLKYQPLDIYVADNASTDNSIEFLQKIILQLKLFPSKQMKVLPKDIILL